MVRLDKWTRCWLAASVVFGAALLFAAFTVPAYNGTISQTLVEANGKKVIFIVAVPLVGALLAMGTIAARRRREREGVGITTWLLLGALGALAALGVLTIGPFVAPVPICLLVAVLRIQETGRVRSQGESHPQSL
jgi:vacuolar-type H+-ATPase subunit I/STV1